MSEVEWMSINGICYEILFLDASDDVLVKRYKETRRGAQRENTLTADAGKRRNRRLCAGCEEQFVIGFRVDLSTIQCVNGDGFLCGIDRSYFLPYPHINAKAVPEALRSLQCQFFLRKFSSKYPFALRKK